MLLIGDISLPIRLMKLTGFTGEVVWDAYQPNGQPRRRLDVSRAQEEFGFKAKVRLEEGLKKTIRWYIQRYPALNRRS